MPPLAKTLERSTHSASVIHAPRSSSICKNPSQLIWVFMIMSIAGLVGETLQHYIAFNEWESRAGLIWGPFSPIYGLAAVIMTVCLEPLQRKNAVLLLVAGGIIGGGLEYFASWAMETYWGVVAWSYLEAPLNFDGRTDVFHMIVWGSLGVLWVKIGLPLCQKAFDHINLQGKLYRICTVLLSIYLVLDIAMTIAVLLRADARTHDVPPQNAFEQYCDDIYPNEVLSERFQNMGGIGIA